MLHNGIYFPEENDNSIGFDPQNLLLFKMSPLTREIIQCYPHVESLIPLFPAEKVRETVEILKKNNIIKTVSTPLPIAPPFPNHYSDFAILLEDRGDENKIMSRETLCQVIDFFLKETSTTPSPGLTFIVDGDVAPLLPLIIEAIQAIRRHSGQKTRILLRVPGFPLSLNLLSLAKKYHLFLYLTFFPAPGVSLLEHVQSVFGTWQSSRYKKHRKQLAAIKKIAGVRLESSEAGDIPAILNLFEANGLPRIHLDWQCRCCEMLHKSQANPDPMVADAGLTESLLRIRYLKDKKKGPHVAGFINHFSLLHTLVASQRSFHGCSAALCYCAITPGGDFYPCHSVTGEPIRIIGNIREGISSQHREKLNIQRVEHRPSCSNCWGRYVCGGGSNIKDLTISENTCRTFLFLLQNILFLYDSLDIMDKNIILDNCRQLDNYLPHLKKSPAMVTSNFENTRVLTVRSDSMKPFLKTGDQVTVAPLHGSKLRVGDIICYGRPIICHRVIARFRQEGEVYIIEKGDSIRAGKKVAEREISGRVVAIRTKKRQYAITSPSWRVINFFIAQASWCMHLATVTFFHLQHKGRKLWNKK